jgi:hypothetical protein
MRDKDTKVLGYVAVQTGSINVFCDDDSCIVAGSEKLMEEYIATISTDRKSAFRITKARYGQILQAMQIGGAYSFDRESYPKFCSLARDDGFELADFTPNNHNKPDKPGISLMRVQWLAK